MTTPFCYIFNLQSLFLQVISCLSLNLISLEASLAPKTCVGVVAGVSHEMTFFFFDKYHMR